MPLKVYTGREGLDEVRPAWDALSARCPVHVFQTPAFASAWAETVGSMTDATPLLVADEHEGELVALFPACIVHQGVVRLATWLGGPYVLDYGDILHDSARCTQTADGFVTDALRLLRQHSRGAFLYLPNVREDALCYPVLRDQAQAYKHGVAPYIPLTGNCEDYLRSLGRKRRHNVALFERRLARTGKVDFRVLGADDPAFGATVAETLRLQRARFSDARSSAPIFDPCYERFRIEHARQDGCALASALTVDGHMIAGSLQCEFRGRMYYLVTGFDPDYSAYAPGKLLVRHLIEYCFARGLSAFDFCWGAEAYKYFWTTREEPLVTFVSDDFAGRLLTSAVGFSRRLAGLVATF